MGQLRASLLTILSGIAFVVVGGALGFGVFGAIATKTKWLDGNVAAEVDVLGFVHHAHSSSADETENAVVRNYFADETRRVGEFAHNVTSAITIANVATLAWDSTARDYSPVRGARRPFCYRGLGRGRERK
jgi:hypothetical protein